MNNNMSKSSLMSSFYSFAICMVVWFAASSSAAQQAPLSSSQLHSSSSSHLQLPSRSDIIMAALNSSSTHPTTNRKLNRNLQDDDDKFASLNTVFATIQLSLPDAQVEKGGLDLSITEIVCGDLSVQDIELSHSVLSNTVQRLGVEVSGVQLTCDFRWEYGYLFFGGTGSGTAASAPTSSISADADFLSEDFELHPPHRASIENCNSDLQIAALSVDDDGALNVMSGIIGLFENLVKDTLEEELGEVVCDQIAALDDEGEAFDDMLILLDQKIVELSGGGDDDGDLLLESDADPLSAENGAEVPLDEEGKPLWINFMELQEFVRDLVDMDLSEVVETVLGAAATSSSASTSASEEEDYELAINSFLRNNVLNDDGLLVVDPSVILDGNNNDTQLFELHDIFTQTTLHIQSISLKGLDSFRSMNVLNPIGNYTLRNELELEYLTLLLEMEAAIRPSSRSDAVVSAAAGEEANTTTVAVEVKEKFVMEFTVRNVALDFAFMLGVNTVALGSMPLGSIGFTENILSCILGAVDEVEFTTIDVTVEEMVPPTLSGFLDAGLDRIITAGGEAIFGMYDQALFKALPNMFQLTLREMLNDYVDEMLADEEGCTTPDEALDGIVDYRDLMLAPEESIELLGSGNSQYGDLFPILYGYLNDIMASVDEGGLSWLNSLIVQLTDDLTLDEDGNIWFPGDLVRQTLKISLPGLNAVIDFGISDVKVSNLDSLGALELLRPIYGQSSTMDNGASIGVGPDPLALEMMVLIKGKGNEVDVHNEFELSLSIGDMSMLLVVLAQMQELPFMNFPLEDVFNIDCWLAAILAPALDQYGIRVDGQMDTGLVLQKLAVAVAEARFDINCISCSSPMMADLEAAMQSPEGIEDTTKTINRILDYGTSLLGGDYVQAEIDRALNEAAYHCPHSPSHQQNFAGLEYQELEPIQAEEESYDFLIAILAVIAVVAVLSALVSFIVRWTSRRRHNRWMKTLSRPQKLELQRMQQGEKDQDKELNKQMTSLVLSKNVPCLVRLLIPIVILGNIVLFLSGHLSLGGTIYFAGSFAGTEFAVDNFFEFSMLQSTIDMWKAGAKALAILIAIFSGVWPYAKQITTLVIWLTPPNNCCFCGLSARRRGKMLHWLDVLGKWSMVDIFVLLLTLASFRLSITSPDHLAFLPTDGLYNIEMMVQPKWGLYANMLAQLVAQLSSHVVIHYHRKTVRVAMKSQGNEMNNLTISASPDLDSKVESLANKNSTRQKLGMHEFKRDYEASDKHAVVRKGANWILLGALLALLALVICGCSLPSFSVEILGIVGLAVESGNRFEQAKTYYSVFDLASMIVDQARFIDKLPDYLGLGTLASILVITVFLVPLAQAASLFAQWFLPMTKKQRGWNTVFNEILSAWQYMEVYVMSIIIAAWQLGGVSDFMINAYCGALEETFTKLVYYGVLDKDDAQCFRVEATVETASWLLVAASLILVVLNHFISAAASQKKQDDNTPPEMRLHTDRWLRSEAPQPTVRAVVYENEEDETIEESPQDQKDDDNERVNVTPISPRFTDYYVFATIATQQHEQLEEQSIGEYDIEKNEAAVETKLPFPVPVPVLVPVVVSKSGVSAESSDGADANTATTSQIAPVESSDSDDGMKSEQSVETVAVPKEDEAGQSE